MKFKNVAALVAVVVLATGLAACGSSDDSAGGSGDLSGKKVSFLTLTPTCEPCARTSEAIKSGLEKEGVKVTMSASDFDGAAEQIQKFNQALSTRPDAIVIWPTDTTSIIPALKQAKQNYPDIPIVITTYKPQTDDTSLWTAWVGGDDEKLGEAAAQSLVDGLKADGKPLTGSVIEIEGAPGAATTIGRKTGFEKALPELAPDLKLVGTQPGNWDQTASTSAASSLFAKDPSKKIVGVYAHSDIMLNGALLAAERDGRTPGKDFVGVAIDCSIEGYKNIESGKQYATGMWDPNDIGGTTAAIALKVLQGEDVPKDTYFKTPQITKNNLADCKGAAGL